MSVRILHPPLPALTREIENAYYVLKCRNTPLGKCVYIELSQGSEKPYYVLKCRKNDPHCVFLCRFFTSLFLWGIKRSEIRSYAQPIPNSLSSLYIRIPPPSHSHLNQHTIKNPNKSRKLCVRLHRISTDSPTTFSKKSSFSCPTKRERLPLKRESRSESQLPFVLGPSPCYASSFFLSFLCRVSYYAGRTVSAGTPVTLVDLLLSWSLPSRGQAFFFSLLITSILPVLSCAYALISISYGLFHGPKDCLFDFFFKRACMRL